MPFDDSNIRKLVRCQLEKKIHFSRYKPLSIECKQLILSLLEPDIKLRATITHIRNNDWIKGRSSSNDSLTRISPPVIEEFRSMTPKLFSPTLNNVRESTVRMIKTKINDYDQFSILNRKNSFDEIINRSLTKAKTTSHSIAKD